MALSPRRALAPAHTGRGLTRAQNRALLDGPFPRGGLVRGVSDGIPLLSEDARVRALELTRIRAPGRAIVRIPVRLARIVAASPPPDFQASDPASPAYDSRGSTRRWGARRRRPATAAGRLPRARLRRSPHRWPYAYPGSWAPNPAALEAFAAALARRYDGSFPDPARPGARCRGCGCCRRGTSPTSRATWSPSGSPRTATGAPSRRCSTGSCSTAFYAGVKSVEPGRHRGRRRGGARGRTRGRGADGAGDLPARSAVLLLSSAAPGVAAGEACPARNRRTSTCWPSTRCRSAIPIVPAASSLDVSISDAAKITGLLAQAERLHTALPAGTQAGVGDRAQLGERAARRPQACPHRLQAAWVSRALHRLWVAGVGLVDWQFLVDPYGGRARDHPDGPDRRVPAAGGALQRRCGR